MKFYVVLLCGVTACGDSSNGRHLGQVLGTWTLNLTGDALPAALAVAAGGATYSASYFSMAGPDMEAIEKNHLAISGNFKVYMNPEDAHGSIVIQKLNPTQLFPTPTPAVRAFPPSPRGRPTRSSPRSSAPSH